MVPGNVFYTLSSVTKCLQSVFSPLSALLEVGAPGVKGYEDGHAKAARFTYAPGHGGVRLGSVARLAGYLRQARDSATRLHGNLHVADHNSALV